MPKTNRIKALIVTSGGTVNDVLSLHPVEWGVWDWDDFNDSPLAYWEDRTGKDELKELFDADADAEILADVEKERTREAEQRASIPFADAPEPEGSNG